MKTLRILSSIAATAALMPFNEAPATLAMTIPGETGQSITAIENYVSPFEKFKDVGFLATDRRLLYSIASNLTNTSSTPLDWLSALSDNHWIASNKRDLSFAKKISLEMGKVLLGKYGVYEADLDEGLAGKFSELRFRCIEQMASSLWDDPDFNIKTLTRGISIDELSLRNQSEFESLYELASKFTCTPLLFQTVSYDMLQGQDISVPNRHIVEPKLQENSELAEQILTSITTKYSQQRALIFSTYSMKKAGYMKYLQHVQSMLEASPMSDYRAVDRGQTSDQHINTCMFNSCFSADVAKGNIPSTKIGSIKKGIAYLGFLTKAYCDTETAQTSPLIDRSKIRFTFRNLLSDPEAEASYSWVSEIYDDVLFPGMLSDVSSTEIQCHSLGMNYVICPKSKVREAGNSLLSYYGSGYFGSENFPITAVSCSWGHAQSLIHV